MAISQSTVVNDNGTVQIQITVPFTQAPTPVAGCLTTRPNMRNLTATQSSTGGSLAGGHNYYYQLVAIDSNGVLSPASDMIEVVVPAGTNTNQISLSGVNPFDGNASQYQVYRAQDAPLTAQLIAGPTTVTGATPFTFTDTGLSTSATLPPTETLDKVAVYWRVTGTSNFNYGAETQDNTQNSLTFLIPVNTGGQSLDIQLRNVTIRGEETPEVLAPIFTYVVTSVYPTSLSIAGAPTSNPVSITAKGSIPPSLPQGIFTYTSTTTSITISWAAFSIPRSDGTTTSVGSGSQTITGLTAGTSYNFYPYYEENAGTVNFASLFPSGSGSPPIAFTTNSASAAQIQNYQGYLALSSGPITAATPASGTGGGGTGGGGTHICVRWGMKVETRERGVVEIQTVEEGEYVSCREGWTEVIKKRIVPMEFFIRVETKRGFAVQVTPTHEIIVADSSDGVPAARLCMNNILFVKDGLDHPRSIEAVTAQRGHIESSKVQLSCEPNHMFFAGESGPDVLVHNWTPIS